MLERRSDHVLFVVKLHGDFYYGQSVLSKTDFILKGYLGYFSRPKPLLLACSVFDKVKILARLQISPFSVHDIPLGVLPPIYPPS